MKTTSHGTRNRRLLRTWIALCCLAATVIANAAHGETENVTCDIDAEVVQVLSANRLLLFGEIHGTDETPRLVGEYVCAVASTGVPVTLGLEIPTQEAAAFERFLASDGDERARRELLESPHWQSPDGRASRGMLALIERLRSMRQAGMPVSLSLVDDTGAAERDAGMAEQVSRLVAAPAGRHVVVLAGNLHSTQANGTPVDPERRNMGALLLPLHPLSIDIRYLEGAAWICTGRPMRCGPTGRRRIQPDDPPPGLALGRPLMPGYDGTLWLPLATPSPPARN